MQPAKSKPGPKTKDSYNCHCCDPPKQFKTSTNKASHEYK
jgi:hypothetical protein